MLNFIRFDPATGAVTSKGFMDPEIVNQLIGEGNPILKYEADDIDISRLHVDIATGELHTVEPVPPAPPPPDTRISFLDLMNLFTAPEKIAIMSSPDPHVRLFTIMAAGATIISMSSNDFINGVDYLASIGIIDLARKKQILDREPPSAS